MCEVVNDVVFSLALEIGGHISVITGVCLVEVGRSGNLEGASV